MKIVSLLVLTSSVDVVTAWNPFSWLGSQIDKINLYWLHHGPPGIGPDGHCFGENIPNLWVWEQWGHFKLPKWLGQEGTGFQRRLSDKHW